MLLINNSQNQLKVSEQEKLQLFSNKETQLFNKIAKS